jgi:hypothetical protein
VITEDIALHAKPSRIVRDTVDALPHPAIIAEAASEECALITIGLGGGGDEALVIVLGDWEFLV